MKFVLLGVIVFLLVIWFSRGRNPSAGPKQSPRPRADEQNPESMLQCSHCGTHFPASEAVVSNGLSYCSKEHYLLGTRDQ